MDEDTAWLISGKVIEYGLNEVPIVGPIASGIFNYFWDKIDPKNKSDKFQKMINKFHNEIIFEVKKIVNDEIIKNNIMMAERNFKGIQDLSKEYIKAYNIWDYDRENEKLKEVLRIEFITVKDIIISTIKLYDDVYSGHLGILTLNILFML